ncbi:MAG: hypothetical protein HOP11_01970 [Saprospiraceae bacterium]|nr:hypothetical protein [Saprospiraceae bacterium]
MNVVILTGEIRSGKTTRLLQFVSGKNSIGGILTPDRDQKRKLYDIEKKEWSEFETELSQNELVCIGKFTFLKDAFKKGNTIILQSLIKNSLTVVDEFGPLEMKGEGFFEAIEQPLLHLNQDSNKTLLLVVRPSILNDFKLKYPNINKIIHFNDPEKLGSFLNQF